MSNPNVLLNFVYNSVPEKVIFYRNVNNKVFGNALYPAPDVTQAEAKAAVDALEAAILAAKDSGHTAVSAMHDAEKKADEVYRKLANYVDRTAAGDETSLLSSGFQISKKHVMAPKPALAAFNGEHPGEVKLVAKAIERAATYHWEMSSDAKPGVPAVWVYIGSSTRATYVVKNLPVKTSCDFRFCVITPDGTSDYCAPVTIIIV
jgi:hypothetical protein